MQPETAFKRRLDRAFDRLFPRADQYRTAIEKGRGQKSGLPDRYYTAPGGHCWMEAKVHPNGLSPLQAAVLPRLAVGSRVVVLTYHPSQDSVSVVEYGPSREPSVQIHIDADEITEQAFWERMLQGGPVCVF